MAGASHFDLKRCLIRGDDEMSPRQSEPARTNLPFVWTIMLIIVVASFENIPELHGSVSGLSITVNSIKMARM